jgi:hypothetical protein
MRPTLAAAVLVLALGLTACTDDDGDPSGSPSPAPTSEATSPSETATSEAAPARDACRVLDPADVGAVLGTTVEPVVAGQGCRFANPDDPATTSLGVSQGDLAAVGGLDGAKQGIGTVVDGEVEDLPNLGDGGFVVIGTTFGGSTPTGGGAVVLGSSLVQITVIPGPDLTEDDVRRTTVEALTLIAEVAGR